MQTKVEIGSATLYLGDCMEYGFPSCHIAVTSPPYNLNKRASGGGTSTRSYEDWYFDDLPEREYQGWQRMVLSRLLDACEGSIFYNHRIRYAWHSRNKFRTTRSLYHPMQWIADFPIWCEIVWNRRGTTGHRNGRCAIADERIFQIGKPHIFNDMGYTTVWDISPREVVRSRLSVPCRNTISLHRNGYKSWRYRHRSIHGFGNYRRSGGHDG